MLVLVKDINKVTGQEAILIEYPILVVFDQDQSFSSGAGTNRAVGQNLKVSDLSREYGVAVFLKNGIRRGDLY